MSEELDPAVAHDLSTKAMASLPLTRGNKVFCTKRQLCECLSRLAQEAYAVGFLAGEKEQFGSLLSAGTAERSAWMNITWKIRTLSPDLASACGPWYCDH